MLIMPTIFKRIFLIYSFLLYLVPKKLRPFLPSSNHRHSSLAAVNPNAAAALLLRPPSLRRRSKRGGGTAAMDQTELRRVFQMFDRNGDGTISKKELSDSLENLGIFIPDKELEEMIRRIDDNGDGSVDIDEFEALYRSIMADRDEGGEEDMMEAFNVFDQNGDGFITVDELRSVLASLGLKQGRTIEECRKMITKVDVDGDGRVNYKEFKQMMKGGGFSALSS